MSSVDHRIRVAAEKRERMRMRLIESALLVFAQKGVEGAVIDDVIAAAEVSRGTFYNYFETNEALMEAVLQELGNEMITVVDAAIADRPDPAERLASALRMVLHTTRQFPHFAQFASRIGIGSAMRNSLALKYLPRDIQGGIDSGRFSVITTSVGVTIVMGATYAAIHAMAFTPGLPETYPEDISYSILLGLGMSKTLARKLIEQPIQNVALPENGLLFRTRNKANLFNE